METRRDQCPKTREMFQYAHGIPLEFQGLLTFPNSELKFVLGKENEIPTEKKQDFQSSEVLVKSARLRMHKAVPGNHP